MRFYNYNQKNLNIEDVIQNIKDFMKADPDCEFKLAVGTDSQVKGGFTCFASGIHIHRVGQGAWCCVGKRVESRRYKSLKEKIARETAITYELVCRIAEELLQYVFGLAAHHRNFSYALEAHIDVGTKGETRRLIREMTGYFEGMGIDAKIKPEAFVASSFASRHSKDLKIG